jgi:pimeloyl-ACP methyl ester carboxylesterase
MKRSLLILHGALGCKAQFNDWESVLSNDWHVHLLDLAGHGTRAGEEAEFSMEFFAEEVESYVRNNKLEGIPVLGYSMGGYIVLYNALMHPGLLGNIMTVATKFDWNPESSKKEAGYLKPEIMLQKVPQLAEQLKQRHGAHWEKVVNKTAKLMIALGENPLITPETAAKIENKIKLCVGDRDKMVSVQETQSIFKGLANGSFCVLPNAGHLPEAIDPKRIAFELTAFSHPAGR